MAWFLDFRLNGNDDEVGVARFEWPERIEFVDSSRDSGLGRQRRGRGYVYTTPEGRRVTDGGTIARIAALAIPPAWTGVWIAPSVHAHLQATGRDKRRRKQYRYHPVWQQRRQRANYERLVEFARALPAIRSFIDAGLRRAQLDKERVLALALRLLDSGMIRVGNEEYAKANGSRGLTTLGKRNVAIRGDNLKFHFVGKGGVDYQLAINDPRAARALRRRHELPGQRLFRYVNEAGDAQPITSGDVNALLEELTGRNFTAKDFRTWAGTVRVFQELGGAGTGRKRHGDGPDRQRGHARRRARARQHAGRLQASLRASAGSRGVRGRRARENQGRQAPLPRPIADGSGARPISRNALSAKTDCRFTIIGRHFCENSPAAEASGSARAVRAPARCLHGVTAAGRRP